MQTFLNFTKKHIKFGVILIFVVVNSILALLFYPVIPIILNYPPESINTQLDIEMSKIPYLFAIYYCNDFSHFSWMLGTLKNI